jgi:hypothetical protein
MHSRFSMAFRILGFWNKCSIQKNGSPSGCFEGRTGFVTHLLELLRHSTPHFRLLRYNAFAEGLSLGL